MSDAPTDPQRVAVIGLGHIGFGVSRALVKAGFTVVGYDVSAEAVARASATHEVAGSVAQACDRAEVALVAVLDDAQVRDALAGDQGLLAAETPPGVAVILSTVTLATVRWAAEACAGYGVGLLDCGVSGGPASLEAASITAMLGGDEALVERARPVLSGFADPVIAMGALGNGMRTKIARNLMVYTDWFVAWEATQLAVAAGVDPARFVEAVKASDRWVRPHMALIELGIGLAGASEDARASGALTSIYARKDLAAALELASEVGVGLESARLALERFDAVVGE